MTPHLQSHQDASNELHPAVYKAVAALLIWFVTAAWLMFGGPGYIDLALSMISVLLFIIIVMLAMLRRTAKSPTGPESPDGVTSASGNADSAASNTSDAGGRTAPFFSWLQGEFSTWTDQEKGSTAAAEILLPFAAVALGITVMGVVLELTRSGVV